MTSEESTPPPGLPTVADEADPLVSSGVSDASFDQYDAAFRDDFKARYAALGGSYEDYRPAYRYGQALREHPRHAGRPWDDIEDDARDDWAATHPGHAWDDVKAAVRHAWQAVTG